MFVHRLKTVILLGTLSGLLMLIGALIGGNTGATVAFVMALCMNGFMYFYADKLVLRMYKARELPRDQYDEIYTTVADLAYAMELPIPKLWIIDSKMPNAFATGRNPKNASIAVTTGIISLLDHDELRGVLAHELSHVKNRDILVATMAATIATAISYAADMLQRKLLYAPKDSNKKDSNASAILSFMIALLTPLIASLIQLAISRTREYMADECGARACHDPLALASALEKIHDNARSDDAFQGATASLFIIRPATKDRSWLAYMQNLFSTHPPVDKRVARLKDMALSSRR